MWAEDTNYNMQFRCTEVKECTKQCHRKFNLKQKRKMCNQAINAITGAWKKQIKLLDTTVYHDISNHTDRHAN